MPIEPVTNVEPFDTLMKGICELEIIDPKSMLIHHKFIWDMLNISDHSNPGIEFDAGSLVPRTAGQLNLKVTGESIQTKDIKVVKDDPKGKVFYIPFVEPSKPSERSNVVIEYDWEEPDRQYWYDFAQQYSHFVFRLIVPNGLEVNPAIHIMRRSGETVGDTLQHAEQFISSILQGKLVLKWHSKDIPARSQYRFDW